VIPWSSIASLEPPGWRPPPKHQPTSVFPFPPSGVGTTGDAIPYGSDIGTVVLLSFRALKPSAGFPAQTLYPKAKHQKADSVPSALHIVSVTTDCPQGQICFGVVRLDGKGVAADRVCGPIPSKEIAVWQRLFLNPGGPDPTPIPGIFESSFRFRSK
jgi:hypothetical protein